MIRDQLLALNGKYNGLNMNKKAVEDIYASTAFLLSDATMLQRIWHIVHDQQEPPKCKNNMCEKRVIWKKWERKYQSYCCMKCSATNPDKEIHRKRTLEQKLIDDPDYYNKRTEKQKQTTLSKYGVYFISQHSKTMEEKRLRYIEAHGVDNPRKDPLVKDKIKQKIFDQYGVTCALIIPEVIELRKQKNIESFGRENTAQLHLSEESLNKLNDREWLYDQHINKKRTMTNIAEELGVYCSTVSYKFVEFNIDKQHFVTTQPQRDIVTYIKSIYSGPVLVNNRTLISPKELDIVIPEFKVAIEYCGLYWHSDDRLRMSTTYHADKLKDCISIGYTLLTIFEDEWLFEQKKIESIIARKIHKSTEIKINARQTSIIDLNYTEAISFFNSHHILNAPPSAGMWKIIGLKHQDIIVAACAINKREYNVYDIVRYATSANVRGGFSKILKHIALQLEPGTRLVSFADLRLSTGTLYETNGFVRTRILPPDYSYIEGFKRVHKSKYRHKYLATKLENYNPSLSESENMKNHRIFKIYNCGLYKYELTI